MISLLFISMPLCNRLSASDDLKKLTNSLSIELIQALMQKDENILISPFSIQTSLLTLYMGSDTLNEYEIRHRLNLSTQQSKIPEAFDQLKKHLLDGKLKSILFFTRTLWVNQPVKMKDDYINLIRTHFLTEIENCDLSDPTATQTKMEEWISQKTKKKIPKFFKGSSLTSTTQAVMTDTATMKSLWKTPFKLKDSSQDFFFPESGSAPPIEIPFMSQKGVFDYFENQRCKIISLPLEHHLRFLIFLPKDKNLSESIEVLSNLILNKSIFSKMQPANVCVQIPKFTISKRYTLNEPLMSLGLIRPFRRDADFSKMSPEHLFYISQIIHYSQITLNEWGVDGYSSLFNLSKEPNTPEEAPDHIFLANHPFLYLIIDAKQDIILFLGTYCNVDPDKKNEI